MVGDIEEAVSYTMSGKLRKLPSGANSEKTRLLAIESLKSAEDVLALVTKSGPQWTHLVSVVDHRSDQALAVLRPQATADHRCQEAEGMTALADDDALIKDYRQKDPEVIVLDPPDAIQHVHNRQSMLQDVADLNLSESYGKVRVPKQLVVKKDPSTIPEAVTKAGLTLPIVAKPLVVDGSPKSHQLSLAYDQFSLSKLDPPLVLQEFVNHGTTFQLL
ncbi:hypothetical protein GIB67_037086 [Kingdonia uniflora]|uniref:inositol-1,3,4-trisphosphate 5/6-kinase n=1 Tax=Kingdonia uniflora TaxID=39325 RepID=A0A7J7LHY8_9MAGN|nr:hypothetical protein GIB67_037086 [Kingdonia uniflora]